MRESSIKNDCISLMPLCANAERDAPACVEKRTAGSMACHSTSTQNSKDLSSVNACSVIGHREQVGVPSSKSVMWHHRLVGLQVQSSQLEAAELAQSMKGSGVPLRWLCEQTSMP